MNLVEHEQEVEDEEDSPLSALLSPLSGTVSSWAATFRIGACFVPLNRG